MAAVLSNDGAAQTWKAAKQSKLAVHKKIAELEATRPEAIDDGLFQGVEDSMAHFRLECMRTVFLSVKLSKEKEVEDHLWQTQTKLNQAYRKVLAQLRRTPKLHVLKHKVERRYLYYLKLSQQFYKGFIQRLASRYIIPEVEEICKTFGLETIEEKDRVDPVTAGIHDTIFKSCYTTLIHLGDLSRYRYQQSQKGLDSGITYYNLAQRLNPDDGTAHHQMGVFFNEQRRHLDITYHFYRAAVCEKPHPNAVQNLEVEFNRAQGPTFLKSRGNTSSQDVLKAWFVRLHANFYKGESFTEYEELETEVLHRLSMAWTSTESLDALLKFVLVNFCAYHVAKKDVSGEWTMPESQFCQFSLRLIVRTTLSLSEAVHAEITNLADDRTRLSPDGTKATDDTFTPALVRLLPVFRLTCAWLVYNHREIVRYQEHLEPHIAEMYRVFGKAQTSFSNVFMEKCPGPTEIAPYLLSEDEETLGLVAMDNRSIFYALRFHYTKDGARKPRCPLESGPSPHSEDWWRVRDILNCGLFLAVDPKFPVQLVDVKGVSEMVYSEDAPIPPEVKGPLPGTTDAGAFDQAIGLLKNTGPTEIQSVMSPYETAPTRSPQNARHLSASPIADQFSAPPQPHLVPVNDSNPESVGYPTDHTSTSFPRQEVVQPEVVPEPFPPTLPSLPTEETDESLYNEMANMVEDLVATESVDPKPQPPLPRPSNAISASSAELLAKLQSPDKAFPSLPWNYFLSPAGAQPPTQPAENSGMNVYQQVYGGQSSFSSSTATRRPQGATAPGWTTSKPQPLSTKWGTSSPVGGSAGLPSASARSPSQIWGPQSSQMSNPGPRQAQQGIAAAEWGQSAPTAQPSIPSGLGGIGSAHKPSRHGHARKTSQDDYDMLFQRLANMSTDPAPNGSRHVSPAGGPTPMSRGNNGYLQHQQQPQQPQQQAQPQQQQSSMSYTSPSYPSFRGTSLKGPAALPSLRQPTSAAASHWPQYQNAFASPTGLDGIGSGFMGGAGSGITPVANSSSIWASTPTGNGRTAFDAPSAYGQRAPQLMAEPAAYRNQVRNEPAMATEYDRQVFASAWGAGGYMGDKK